MRVKTCGLIIFLFACAASSVIIATGCPVAHLVASSVSKDVQGSSTATAFTAAFSQSAPARCYRSYLRFPASFDPHTPRFAPISTLQHKNHTGNNYMSRCHRNGIKRVPNFRFKSLKGVRCAPPPTHTHKRALALSGAGLFRPGGAAAARALARAGGGQQKQRARAPPCHLRRRLTCLDLPDCLTARSSG